MVLVFKPLRFGGGVWRGVEQQKGILGFTHAHESRVHRHSGTILSTLCPIRPWAWCASCGWLCAYSGGKAIIHGQTLPAGPLASRPTEGDLRRAA